MANSPVFDHICAQLEERSQLDRLEARGTVRIALKEAGLDAGSVDAEQMAVVLRRILPGQLRNRGIDDGEGLCEAIVTGLAGMAFDVAHDRAGDAARTMARLGS